MNKTDQDAKRLLLEITRCDVARQHCEHTDMVGPCSEIVATQGAPSWEAFQVPEPWSGDIVKAPILFLSSNPSISKAEAFPDESWDDPTILDFFEHRFDGHWVRDGKPRNKDGTYRRRAVAYWSHIRNRASELLGRPAVPGVDYVLSEVVHCKSEEEKGVPFALNTCSGRYLKKLLLCSGAVVIVLVGKKSLGYWNSPQIGLAKAPEKGIATVEIEGRKRLLTFLPHTNAREKRKFIHRLSASELARVRSLLDSKGISSA